MTELLLNALIILEVPKDKELRAFWHMYSFAKRAIRDARASDAENRDARAQVDAAHRKLPQEHQVAARRYVFNDPSGYWHSNAYAKPLDACDALFIPEMAETYKDLSSAAHGGYLGQSLFRSSDQAPPESRTKRWSAGSRRLDAPSSRAFPASTARRACGFHERRLRVADSQALRVGASDLRPTSR